MSSIVLPAVHSPSMFSSSLSPAKQLDESGSNSPIIARNQYPFIRTVDIHSNLHDQFMSHALSLEHKFHSFFSSTEAKPTWERIAKAFEILDEIIQIKTPYQKLLTLLRWEIGTAVFQSFPPSDSNNSPKYSELVPFFWIVQQFDSKSHPTLPQNSRPPSAVVGGGGAGPVNFVLPQLSSRSEQSHQSSQELTDEQAEAMDGPPPPSWMYSKLHKWLKGQSMDRMGDPELDRQREENKLWSVCSKYMGKYKNVLAQLKSIEEQRGADVQKLHAATQEMTQTRAALLDMKSKLQAIQTQLEEAVGERQRIEKERTESEKLWRSNFRVLTEKMLRLSGEGGFPENEEGNKQKEKLSMVAEEEDEEEGGLTRTKLPAEAMKKIAELEKMVLSEPHSTNEGDAAAEEPDLTTWTNRITPRPNWNAIRPLVAEDLGDTDFDNVRTAECIENICENYCKMKIMLRAVQKTEKENQEWDGPKRNEVVADDRFFVGLGLGPHVPKYLRFKGKVRNRRLSKRDAEHLVKEIWKAKCASDKDIAMPMDDFVFAYLVKRFGNIPSVIADWAYNMMDALERYSYDPDCDMLLKILKGELVEDLYHEQSLMIDQCVAVAVTLDKRSNGGRLCGKIRKLDLLEAIQDYFGKSGKEMKALEAALDEDAPNTKEVEYNSLFEEDREGNQGEFAEEFRDQHMLERKEYLGQMEVEMYNRGDGRGMITWKNAVRGLQACDPFKGVDEVNQYVARGFGVDESLVLDENATVLIETFMANMRRGQVKRSKQHKRKFTLNRGQSKVIKEKEQQHLSLVQQRALAAASASAAPSGSSTAASSPAATMLKPES